MAERGEPSATPTKQSKESQFEEAKKLKDAGNEFFKSKNLKKAIGKYHRSLLYIKAVKQNNCSNPMSAFLADFQEREPLTDPDLLNNARKLEIDCYNNLAACLLMVKPPNYDKILQYCEEVLTIEEHNTKALYRRGVSLYHLKCIDAALESLNLARTHGGANDSKIKDYIDLCNQELEKQDQKMKAAYRGMFDKMSLQQNGQES